MDRASPGDLVGPLLRWYASQARPLPWRSRPEPYRVLLSELMCQQTRVATAIPYFERFVTRWPTLDALAAADEDDVLHEWAGLGYYSRARNLHRCARAAVAAGGLPSNPAELRALPGIGPYTAGAVASIAFGVRTPVVDGNVERVISRLDARDADPRSTLGRRALWERATELHEALSATAHPGDLNQALMELGATVCVPKRPACGDCPVGKRCVGRASGAPERWPMRPPRKKPVPVFGVAGVLRVGERVVLGRRPPGLLGRLWEPVGTELDEGADARAALVAAFRDRAGVDVVLGTQLGEVVHVFTHRRLRCAVFAATAIGEVQPAARRHYTDVRLADPGGLAMSRLAHKVLELAAQPPLPLTPPSAE